MASKYFNRDEGYARLAARATAGQGVQEAEVAFTIRTYPLLAAKLAVLAKTVNMSRNQMVVEMLQTACAEVFAALPPEVQVDVDRMVTVQMRDPAQ